jgi:hypothetical protein
MAQLDAADSLANAPTPLWNRIKEILQPLSSLSGIGSFILKILQLIG